jgi:hypothetical protein
MGESRAFASAPTFFRTEAELTLQQQGGEHMIRISKKGWAASLTMLALLYTPAPPGVLSGAAWAQGRPVALRTTLPPSPRRLPGQTASRISAPVALPVSEPTGGALGTALASCDKVSESSEALILPGLKGDVKLDRCYRGRDHLACSFNALLTEAKFLIEEYGKIVEAHYPDVSNVDGVCRIKPDNLATDLQQATDFTNRFKALKAEYNVRTNCASKIGQSLKDVTLRDIAQAPELLKSMIDSIEGDVKGISVAQAKVVELAEKIDSSQKAITTIRMIHRTMCLKDQRAVSQANDRASQ